MASLETFKLSLLLTLCFTTFSHSQGKRRDVHEYRYSFIKRASSLPALSVDPRSGEPPRYDYIVVGGGTAGCPLAATLSQRFRVLVLERGGVPFNNPNVTYFRNFHIGLADLSPTSASQPFVSTDGVINSRARVLGGGSSINAGFYSRASPRYIERVGWDPQLVKESYEWVEKQIVWQPDPTRWQLHVRDALLDIGLKPYNGFTYDHVHGTKFGGTIFDRFGRRHSTAELLARADPRRLTVLVHAAVQKIVFDTSGGRPKAVAVIFKDENGKHHLALLGNGEGSEVILSCGAMGSPQMLMLSGIGPKRDLRRLNISLVLGNEMVGKGMVDNPLSSLFVPAKRPLRKSLIQTVGITKKGVYIEASSGFGQSQDSIHRRRSRASSAQMARLPTTCPNQRSMQETVQLQTSTREDEGILHESFNGGFILAKFAAPLSTGRLSLVSTDPDHNPSITFNYFGHPHDLRLCVESVRLAAQIASSDRLLNHTGCEKHPLERILNESLRENINFVPKSPHSNTKSLEQFCKDSVTTIWHYHGGCHVGKVVDEKLKVVGVNRLRVVDGSVFNESPGTNPQATVMMLGRYMGIKILRERLGNASAV